VRTLDYASRNPQLSQLRRGDFIRLAAVSVLRIEVGYGFLPFVLCHDVHRQQALPTLWRGG
jgi:hypothetical protein